MTTRRRFLRNALSAAVATALPPNPLFGGTVGRYEGAKFREPGMLTLADIQRAKKALEAQAVPWDTVLMAIHPKTFQRFRETGALEESDVISRYEGSVVIDPRRLFADTGGPVTVEESRGTCGVA